MMCHSELIAGVVKNEILQDGGDHNSQQFLVLCDLK